MSDSAFKNIMKCESVNAVSLAQHVQSLLDYMTSKDYAKETLEEASNKIKLCNSKLQKPKQSPPADNRKYEKEAIRSKQDLLSFKLPSAQDTMFKVFSNEVPYFAWAGISLGDDASRLITQALKKLAGNAKPKSIRFWGKIFAREQDYYIIQGVTTPFTVDAQPEGVEKFGEGVNAYTYWATTDLSGKWEELPVVTPEYIKVARKLKYFLTGRLEKDIEGYPMFPGKEKHYLKCQLARITHSCEITPKGVYKLNDENPKVIEYEEEVKVPEIAELSTAEGWVHQDTAILNLGRCTHWIDPNLPQEQRDAITAELAEKDPEVDRLKPITEDKTNEKSGTGLENPWIVRSYGDNQVFTKDEGSVSYNVAALTNVHWPGWLTIGYRGGWSSIYVGWGHKSTQYFFTPLYNRDLQEEPEDRYEFYEPNPKYLPKPPAEDEPKPEEPPE